MAATIILCFMLTIMSVLTINSISSLKVSEQTSLNNAVDSAIRAIELDNTENSENYEKVVNDLLQLIILQSSSDGNINIKILEANTKEGLLDVEVKKTYTWFGIKKDVTARRTVILEEFENPEPEYVKVKFVYRDIYNYEITHREGDTFVGAILKRPKNPKKQGYTFTGWSLTYGGPKITDDEWQNFIIPEDTAVDGVITFYALFEENS